MTSNNPKGFIEYRTLNGKVDPATRMYRVRDNGDANQFQHYPIRKGDPVVLVSGNRVARIPAVLTANPDNATVRSAILGIVRACYSVGTGNRPRPMNGNPATAFIAASADGFVDVNIDPMQTYLVNTDATVTPAMINYSCNITALASPLIPNQSGMSLNLSTAVIAPTTAAPFTIIGLGAGDENDALLTLGDPDSRNADVEVVIGKHRFSKGDIA